MKPAKIMNTKSLEETAKAMVAGGKGLLAMDESVGTCNKRFASLGIPETETARRDYREMIITTLGLGESISGVILHDETIHQKTKEGRPFLEALADTGIIPGIKVDGGTTPLAGHSEEKVTEGLDGLRARLAAYAGMGLRFAKWRAVLTIGEGIPTQGCIGTNMHLLARYAALCQEAGLVPIVEPEVLMDGAHTMAECEEASSKALQELFIQLHRQRVLLEGLILKPNMILAGLECPHQPPVREVADVTVRCLKRNVPASVPGIAFLSGGQSSELASARLNSMNSRHIDHRPWELSFSFARAIQQPAMKIWGGNLEKVPQAQSALRHRAACNRAARRGEYTSAMEQMPL